MSERAHPPFLDMPAGPSALLPRAKGLLDPFKIPLGLRSTPGRQAAATADLRLHGRFEIAARLLLLWIKLSFARSLRPSRLTAVGSEIGQWFARFQGFWPELGQLLSQRAGMLPAEVREQLRLHCQPAPALSFAQVEALVTTELGVPLGMVFSRFEATPVRIGNYADTYHATLRLEGVDVEVKVQRPLLQARLTRDLRVFAMVSAVLRRINKRRPHDFDDLASLYADRVPALLDLRYEASVMRRMRRSLRDHKVDVPKLFSRYASRSVIVCESIRAPTLQELLEFRARDPQGAKGWLWANGVDLETVGRRLYHSMLRQVCEDNFFLLNFSPSNIFLLRDSRVAVVSCESAGSVDKRFLTIFNLALAAMARNAYEKFADTLLLLCDSLPSTDLGDVRAELVRVVRTHAARSVLQAASHEEKSLFLLTSEISSVLHRHGIVLDWQMLKLMMALGSVDPAVSACYPGMNHNREQERYARKAAARRLRQVFAGGIGNAVLGVVSPLSEMMRFETASLRKKAQTFRASTGKLASVGATLVRWLGRALIVGAIYGLWLFLHDEHYDLLAPFHGTAASNQARNAVDLPYDMWILASVGVFILYRAVRDVARYLAQKEVHNPPGSR